MRKLMTLTGLAAVVVLGLMAANTGAASLAAIASGSVTILGPQVGAPNGDNRTFSFSANEASDGTVTGQMALRTFSGNIAHGNLTCMTIENNQAIIGGVYTKFSQDPTQVGVTFAFAIQDNPDMATFVNFPFSSTPCQDFLPDLGYASIGAALADPNQSLPIRGGNITIKQLG
jgi:hypothetical protein